MAADSEPGTRTARSARRLPASVMVRLEPRASAATSSVT